MANNKNSPFINTIFSTDTLPIVGGATGALTQTKNIMFPTIDTIIYTIIITVIGALVGYGIKLFLDWVLKKIK